MEFPSAASCAAMAVPLLVMAVANSPMAVMLFPPGFTLPEMNIPAMLGLVSASCVSLMVRVPFPLRAMSVVPVTFALLFQVIRLIVDSCPLVRSN